MRDIRIPPTVASLNSKVETTHNAWRAAAQRGYGDHTLPLDLARIDRRIGHLKAQYESALAIWVAAVAQAA